MNRKLLAGIAGGMGLAAAFIWSAQDFENGRSSSRSAYIWFGHSAVVTSLRPGTGYPGSWKDRLKLSGFSLEVAAEDEEFARSRLNAKTDELTSWFMSHLSAKTIHDGHGSAQQHQLAREIREHFSPVLFPNSEDRVLDVLIPEYAVQ